MLPDFLSEDLWTYHFLSSATIRIYLAFMRTSIVCYVVLNNCWGDGWDPDPWNQDTDPRIRIHIFVVFVRIQGTMRPRLRTHFSVFTWFEGSEMPIFFKRSFGENQSVLEFTLSKAWSSQGMMMVSYLKFLHDQPFSTPFSPGKLPFSSFGPRCPTTKDLCL